jgi:hypothetical protein
VTAGLSVIALTASIILFGISAPEGAGWCCLIVFLLGCAGFWAMILADALSGERAIPGSSYSLEDLEPRGESEAHSPTQIELPPPPVFSAAAAASSEQPF